MVWRRGYEVLATGHLVVSADPRISVEKHSGVNTLVIKHISQQDAGEYVCQVSIFYINNWHERSSLQANLAFQAVDWQRR